MEECSSFFTSFPASADTWVYYLNHSVWCEVESDGCFYLNFTPGCWKKVLNASQPFNIPSLKILNLALYPILIGLFGSLVFILSSWYILDISPLSDVGFVKIVFKSIGCCFVLLTVLFTLQSFAVLWVPVSLLLILEHKTLLFYSEKFPLCLRIQGSTPLSLPLDLV